MSPEELNLTTFVEQIFKLYVLLEQASPLPASDHGHYSISDVLCVYVFLAFDFFSRYTLCKCDHHGSLREEIFIDFLLRGISIFSFFLPRVCI